MCVFICVCFLFFPQFFSGFLSQVESPFNLKRQSSVDCSKERGRWNGETHIKERGQKRGSWEKEWQEEGEGAGIGNSRGTAAVRLNDIFQEEQSSLSNRRLQNELAYLLGLPQRCRATVSHIPSIRQNNAIVRETERAWQRMKMWSRLGESCVSGGRRKKLETMEWIWLTERASQFHQTPSLCCAIWQVNSHF